MKKHNIISDWLNKHGDPVIDEKVEKELKRISNMEKIPTATELLRNKYKLEGERGTLRIDQVSMFMTEFAEMHVKAALKAASENVSVLHTNYHGSHKIEFPYSVDNYSDLHLDKDSILNSYSIENIK